MRLGVKELARSKQRGLGGERCRTRSRQRGLRRLPGMTDSLKLLKISPPTGDHSQGFADTVCREKESHGPEFALIWR